MSPQPAYLDGYTDVAERIRLFYERFPNGQIRTGEPKWITVGDRMFITQYAEVFTSPTEPNGWKAYASEPFPGLSNYTRNSEQMNCETSAVGRALGLMGIGLKGSIATVQDIRNRREETNLETNTIAGWIDTDRGVTHDPRPPRLTKSARDQLDRIRKQLATHADTPDGQRMIVETILEHPVEHLNDLTSKERNTIEGIMIAIKDDTMRLEWADDMPRIWDVDK